MTQVKHIGRGTTRHELDGSNSEEGRLMYAPEQRSGRDSTKQRREHVGMKIPTLQRNRL